MINLLLKKAGLRYVYNSGLATALFGHVPLCIGYGYYIETAGLTTAWDWVFGALYAVFAYAVFFRLIIMKVFEDKNSPYPFDATEMARFDRLYQRLATGNIRMARLRIRRRHHHGSAQMFFGIGLFNPDIYDDGLVVSRLELPLS